MPRLRVRHMTRKWGSCSTLGVITLLDDLAYQETGFQDFVIAHELLHLRVPNHGKLFKALLSTYAPDWGKHRPYRQGSSDTMAPSDPTEYHDET